MPDVYVAPEPHRCPVVSPWLHMDYVGRPDGSIWNCDECGLYWLKRRAVWRPVVVWNLRALWRIRRWERSNG